MVAEKYIDWANPIEIFAYANLSMAKNKPSFLRI